MCVSVMRDNPSIRSKLSFPFDSIRFSLFLSSVYCFTFLRYKHINTLSLYFFSSLSIGKQHLDTIVHSTHHDSQLVSLHNIAAVGIGGHYLGSRYRRRKWGIGYWRRRQQQQQRILNMCSLLLQATNETYIDRIAAFGPRLTEEGVLGSLLPPTHEDDRYGCDIVTPPCENWVALIERGECSFVDKVRAMQASGAIAAVVGDKHYNGWITMYAPG